MCLIIKTGSAGTNILPRHIFDYVYARNSDGYGAMWVQDGTVMAFKSVTMTADEIYEHMLSLEGRNAIFHMRMRTHGPVNDHLCHPFRVLRKRKHGRDVFMMHNGVINKYGNIATPQQSDTTAFNKKFLIPLLAPDSDIYITQKFKEDVSKETYGSRLCLLSDEGTIVATGHWPDRYGCSVSNEYMLPSVPKVYGNAAGFGGAGWRQTQSLFQGQNCGDWNDPLDDDPNTLPPFALPSPSASNVTPIQRRPAESKTTIYSVEEKLRWQRIQSNTKDGLASLPEQLVADMICSSDFEVEQLCKEAPETASSIIASLLEYIITLNNIHNFLDFEQILEKSDQKTHFEAMKAIFSARSEQINSAKKTTATI